MLVVHHLETSRSHRIIWLLEELGVPYEMKVYKRHPFTRLAPPELKAVHPLGKSPVIVDDGITIAESGPIIEYLLERYGQNKGGDLANLVPTPGTPEHRECRYFMHYAEGSLMLILLIALVFRVLPRHTPWLMRPMARKLADAANRAFIGPNMKTHLGFLEGHLATHSFMAGEHLTGADFQMGFIAEILLTREGLREACPGLAAYRDKLAARPAWTRAIQKGGQIVMEE